MTEQNSNPEGIPSKLPHFSKARIENRFVSVFLKTALFFVSVVLVAVCVSWAFGWIAFEKINGETLYNQTVSGRKEMRAIAAMEWAKQLQIRAEENKELLQYLPNETQIETLSWELKNFSTQKEPSIPLYIGIATVLGFSKNSDLAYDTLKSFLRDLPLESAGELRIAAFLALARLGIKSDEDVMLFLDQAKNPDPSVRKAVAFVLGSIEKASTDVLVVSALELLLEDEKDDVRWNAAFSLARKGNSKALPTLTGLIRRAEDQDPNRLGMSDLRLFEETFRAVVKLEDPVLKGAIEKMADGHRNLKLRQMAKDWVAKF